MSARRALILHYQWYWQVNEPDGQGSVLGQDQGIYNEGVPPMELLHLGFGCICCIFSVSINLGFHSNLLFSS